MDDHHDFLVLGDLTKRVDGQYTSPARRLIVRMFIGAQTFDEELDISSLEELHATVVKRVAELEERRDVSLIAEALRPLVHPGHAVAIPPAPPQE